MMLHYLLLVCCLICGDLLGVSVDEEGVLNSVGTMLGLVVADVTGFRLGSAYGTMISLLIGDTTRSKLVACIIPFFGPSFSNLLGLFAGVMVANVACVRLGCNNDPAWSFRRRFHRRRFTTRILVLPAYPLPYSSLMHAFSLRLT